MSKPLRILVPIKRVIDPQLRPRINAAGTAVQKTGVQFSVNPFDDIAVEEAVRIREAKKVPVESIHAVSIGPAKAQEALLTAMAKGADSSTLVDAQDSELEPLAVAKILRELVVQQKIDLVIMGKQATDSDNNNTGQMLAGLLNWPQATNAARVELDATGTRATVTREVEGGEEVVSAALPLVVTTDLRLNTPRYVTLPNKMKAKKKPMAKLNLAAFPGVDSAARLNLLRFEEPPARAPGTVVASVDELLAKLREAKAV
ncbi:ACL129Wp [Eremothecium gossypii ATCC 10895]|uniref:Probable electron transfer flavoprotein subunit beta n=1 Tax=Eremothecium gossypii (strain ATCC 10895 / CBS 109.51 / FGSC 9923 / NRRL Y-1056) TaxID=284811 RepID=Q75CP8_EREGS|nr:ACL129Wp [Eremothecium gossypii ATCC 10895]AAS51099.1 ACL129Wp [Eremothecium gossypii ATCC 10895]AEY95389.1 FACL129Wp [Eremothecium gossypii FDAG1]